MTKILNFLYHDTERQLFYESNYFKITTDNLTLSNFIKIRKTDDLLVEFGSGIFTIPILLTCKSKIKICGIEQDKNACELASKSLKYNNLYNQVFIINDVVQNIKKYFLINSVSIVVCNPPYFINGNVSQNDIKAFSRHEMKLTLEEVVYYANLILKNNGRLYLVQRVERLFELRDILKKYNFAIKRIQFIYPTRENKAKLCLIEASKNGREMGLIIDNPLILGGK